MQRRDFLKGAVALPMVPLAVKAAGFLPEETQEETLHTQFVWKGVTVTSSGAIGSVDGKDWEHIDFGAPHTATMGDFTVVLPDDHKGFRYMDLLVDEEQLAGRPV